MKLKTTEQDNMLMGNNQTVHLFNCMYLVVLFLPDFFRMQYRSLMKEIIW